MTIQSETHTHSHGDAPAHTHSHEAPHVPARGAVLDIGGSVGALLVATSAELAGAEIELYDESGLYLMHTEVHERTVNGRRTYAGLFPAVCAGSYWLDTRAASRRRVEISGGEVATVDLS